jgi:fumarate hydratase class II
LGWLRKARTYPPHGCHPVTFGQEFAGYAAQIRYGIERINSALPRVAEVPQGGTATGTGINTPKGFPQEVISLLAKDTGLPITEPETTLKLKERVTHLSKLPVH